MKSFVLRILAVTHLISVGIADEVINRVPQSKPWKCHTIDATSQGADGVRLADINGDGRQDIVTGWEEGGVVRWYRNPGSSKALEPWPREDVGQVGSPEDAVFADVDGDGRFEILSSCEGKTLNLFLHQKEAKGWTTTPVPGIAVLERAWMMSVSLDVDGKGGRDFLLGSKGEGADVGWLEGGGDWRYTSIRPAGWIMSLELADLDRDGDQDAVISDRRGKGAGVFWLEKKNGVEWIEHRVDASEEEYMFLDVGDLNGDDQKDIVCPVKPSEIRLYTQTGGHEWAKRRLIVPHEHTGRMKAVRMGDLDQDGDVDLVYSCEGADGPLRGVVWLEKQKDQPWIMHDVSGEPGLKYDHMKLLDLDGDGDLDVLTCEERDQLGVIWYENPHASK
ncbi:MAG: hypothetical protein ACI8T1_004537 [Verrucomicrobiales bacterium]|jgi:hypothetical protein